MNALNSIKKWQEHPLYSKWRDEIQRFWKCAEQDINFSWWLLAFIAWISLSVLLNAYHHYQVLKQYSFQKDLLSHYHPRRVILELDSQYLMGTPISKSAGRVIMEPLVIEAILYNENPEKREVLLRHANRKVLPYHIGDTTSSGIKIVDIKENYIKLEMGGAETKLRVKEYRNDFLSDKPLNDSTSIFQDRKE